MAPKGVSMKFLSYFPNPNRWSADCSFCGDEQKKEEGLSFKKDGDWMTACYDCFMEHHGAAPCPYEFNSLGHNKQRAKGFVCGTCHRRFAYIKSAAGKWYGADVASHPAAGGEAIIPWRPHHETCGMTYEEIYAFEKENQK
jgi:hypothetical protein